MLQQKHNNCKCKNTNFIDRGLAYQNLLPLGILPLFKFFWKVIGYRYQRKLPELCNRQIFWPKGKKYILCTKKFFLYFLWFFMIIWVILGGVSLLNFFWFEPLFLSYRTNKLQKLSFMRFSRNLNSMKKCFFCKFYF